MKSCRHKRCRHVILNWFRTGGNDLIGRRRGIQRQGETDRQKSVRLENAARHRNRDVSCDWVPYPSRNVPTDSAEEAAKRVTCGSVSDRTVKLTCLGSRVKNDAGLLVRLVPRGDMISSCRISTLKTCCHKKLGPALSSYSISPSPDLPPFNGHHSQREILSVSQLKEGIQYHEKRKSRLSRSSPMLREVEVDVGGGKTVAEAAKEIGVTERTYSRNRRRMSFGASQPATRSDSSEAADAGSGSLAQPTRKPANRPHT